MRFGYAVPLLRAENCKYYTDKMDTKDMTPEQSTSALSTQIGGSHYKDMAIQPVEFSMKNNLNFCQASAIKYICRYRNKNGVQDIDKAIHFLQLLKEIEYGGTETK